MGAIPLGDEAPRVEPPIANISLILANVIIFVVGVTMPWLLLPGAKTYNEVVYELGLVPARIVAGQRLYTIFTSMFLHGGILHLLGNMLYLYIFGDNIENVMGSKRYVVFYILSGVGATLFHVASIAFMPAKALANAALEQGVSPWLVPAIGASGAISGVLGAYLILFPSAEIRVMTLWGFIPFFLRLPASVYIIFWFVYQLMLGLSTALTGVSAGIAFWAHVGGFLTGMALTPLFVDKKRLIRVYLEYRLAHMGFIY
ncbi:MAG: rhomboid family intramembrane serine protease [Desulfurococcales archaeon]|nr:rhomboid family intramembrane serine protease [Desulfurococcales archaeon]